MPSDYPEIRLTPFVSLNTKDDKFRLSAGNLMAASNVVIYQDGSVGRLDGYADRLNADLGATADNGSVYLWNHPDGTDYELFTYNGTLYRRVSAASTTSLITGLALFEPMDFIPYLDRLYCSNRINQPKKYNGTTVKNMGISPPANGITLADTGSAGNLGTGSYLYRCTFYNLSDGVESAGSPIASISISGTQVNLTGIPQSGDTQVEYIRLYRTTNNGSVYRLLAQIAHGTTSYTDNIYDSSLGYEYATDGYYPPPPFSMGCEFFNRMYVAGNIDYPNRLYPSEQFNLESYLTENQEDFEFKIKMLARLPNGILIAGDNTTLYYAGTDISNFVKMRSDEKIGCSNYASLIYIDELPYWMSNYGWVRWNGNGIEILSDIVNPTMLAENRSNSTAVFDKSKNLIYIATG